MEFHISRRSRQKYSFDESLFAFDGNIILANFPAVRHFAQKMNSQRELVKFPDQAIKDGELNAAGLIDEIFHYLFSLYLIDKNAQVIRSLDHSLSTEFGEKTVNKILFDFISAFPPQVVYSGKMNEKDYLTAKTGEKLNRESALEELIILLITNQNAALKLFDDLFFDPDFSKNDLTGIFRFITNFFETQETFGPENQNLIIMLRTPAIRVPDSITGQLEFIRTRWSALLGDYLYRLLTGLDLLKEENKLTFLGHGPVEIPLYDLDEFLASGGKEFDMKAFSMDRDWMPRLVLIAKNSFVWLDQLSKKYSRSITQLDQIPDVELKLLRDRGITGLWLIGLWERSPASAKIKQMCGNSDAISSAYSLYSYQIAADLGGEVAYSVLRDKSAKNGIRLASDMVPNHMGIDSDWVINYPERFLSLEQCPFPSYTYSSTDLSSDPRIVVQVEDHYFDKTDAAVVFKRYDRQTGQTKFIYHGNDGTSMPWNDTAQLNYLSKDVREAVIQTILDVARKFPIIRFDAAMTLAKKHFQRLWFPLPGTGGAIPSRSEFGISKADFDRAFPVEFWREVVNRVAKEAPDTLLLAEAFWLMEGYFVRTLGMHRVYNSAFMHMLRNEDNAGYHKLIDNTLEYEPEILKRYVNFMNNPDEKTAAEQFGTGDKYFGVCTMMVTLPGLPMLGHGQIEGFSEKYGMEFKHAYWDETINEELVSRHNYEIFPLLHHRELFAGVDHFAFYELQKPSGEIDTNVYAYSNQLEDQKALVVFNNSYYETDGWINSSVPKLQPTGDLSTHKRFKIADSMGFHSDPEKYLLFRDQTTGLRFVRPLRMIQEQGFYFKLKGYEHHVFLDFSLESSDNWHNYPSLYQAIGDSGVKDIEIALKDLYLQPVIQPLKEIINTGYFNYLYECSFKEEDTYIFEAESKLNLFLNGIVQFTNSRFSSDGLLERNLNRIKSIVSLRRFSTSFSIPGLPGLEKSVKKIVEPITFSKLHFFTLLVWAILSNLGELSESSSASELTLSWIDEWQLLKPYKELLIQEGVSETDAEAAILEIKLLLRFQDWYADIKTSKPKVTLKNWISDPDVQVFLKVNRFDGVLWFSKESFEKLLIGLSVLPIINTRSDTNADTSTLAEIVLDIDSIISKLRALGRKSKYNIEKLLT